MPYKPCSLVFEVNDKERIKSAEDAVRISRAMILDDSREHQLVFCLNTRNRILTAEIVSIGTLNASLVHPREVFKRAVLASAASIILSHNHPSGEVSPSPADIEVNDRLKAAGKVLGIELIDSIIFSKEQYYSMKEKGVL